MNKPYFHLATFMFILLTIGSFKTMNAQPIAVFETTAGTFRIKLFRETPKHSENFVKLIKSGYYDSVLFHRVISGFMVQTGDPNSKSAQKGQQLGDGGPGYTIPAEFNPELFHKKGAVAAARLGDQMNPAKSSSGSQFYIVQGQVLTQAQLDMLVNSGRHPEFTSDQKIAYTTLGGTPHLDNNYTVFGEISEGLDVIDNIAASATDERNRPIDDIRVIRAYIEE
jgi:cyclophilin family peptidyl-prolyl cis-trans isomerase